jgi:integrase
MGYSKQDVQTRLENFQNLEYISEENKEDFKEFINCLITDPNLSDDRVYKYITNFKTIFRKIYPHKDLRLKTASKKEVREIAANIQKTDYSEWYKHDQKVCLRKYFKTLYQDKFERPKRVKKILNANFLAWSGEPENKHDIEALTPTEVNEMIESSDKIRDKLIILLFFETGGRLNELRSVNLSDIEMNQKYAEITLPTLKNNKGPRKLQLTKSVGLLQQWLEKHPNKDNPDSPLLVNIGSKYKGEKIYRKQIQRRKNI